MQEDLVATVGGFPLFRGIDEEALRELAARAICHDYPKNNLLFYRGDPGGTVFLVLAGNVKITMTNEEGREVIVTLLDPGDLFGLLAAVDGGTHPSNAVTASAARLARFKAETFVRWMEGNPAAQRLLIRELARRVREAYLRVGEHALLGAKERLLSTLLEIAERHGRKDDVAGSVCFTRPTHQELASRIGSSREVVSRLLKELLKSRLLQEDGRTIHVSHAALVFRREPEGVIRLPFSALVSEDGHPG